MSHLVQRVPPPSLCVSSQSKRGKDSSAYCRNKRAVVCSSFRFQSEPGFGRLSAFADPLVSKMAVCSHILPSLVSFLRVSLSQWPRSQQPPPPPRNPLPPHPPLPPFPIFPVNAFLFVPLHAQADNAVATVGVGQLPTGQLETPGS